MRNNHINIEDPKLFSAFEIKKVLNTFPQTKGFNIPIYQRLYSWGNREIVKLLDDVLNSYKENNSKDYYIGNLTLNFNETTKYFDIIDGQQRMTTLWLIALVFKIHNSEINGWDTFLFNEDSMLLNFTAREDDNVFLKRIIKDGSIDEITSFSGEKTNVKMIEAIKSIHKYIYSKKEKKDDFNLEEYSNYFLKYVKMAAIYLPESIDLNKYFEDMNNRGLQLEAHHIVKAKLLEKIDKSLHSSYGKVWDAVSQMNQYVEYGFTDSEETLKRHRERLINCDIEYYCNPQENNIENITPEKELKDIIANAQNTQIDKENLGPINDKITSILNFPEFLLICLELFLNKQIPFDDKKLDKIFSEHIKKDNFNSKAFIEHLFIWRILFDKYIIKSVTTNEETKWEIREIKMTNFDNKEHYLRYSHLDRKIIQIQSFLNVSTVVNLWLPDALRLVFQEKDYVLSEMFNKETFCDKLEEIDIRIHSPLSDFSILNIGTSTNRYWFFKLDYLLWKRWNNNINIPNFERIDSLKVRIDNFEFRENRSVEHIHAQNPDIETWDSEDVEELKNKKNQFGNLALISIRSNSSYKNQSFDNKKEDFIKRTKNWGIESLKLLSAYSYSEWTIENMEKHQEEMINLLSEHYMIKTDENQ